MNDLTASQNNLSENSLYDAVKKILQSARNNAYKAINFSMVQAYWQIDQLIVGHEQKGKERAEYGKRVLEDLSKRLLNDFGKGFDARELRRMRQFYLAFPIWDALRPELSWSHYRLLIGVENDSARSWYMNEAIAENWSSRQLERHKLDME